MYVTHRLIRWSDIFYLFSKPYMEHIIYGYYIFIKIIKKTAATMPGHKGYLLYTGKFPGEVYLFPQQSL